MTKQVIDWKKVQSLLDRFYDGATTQDEEQYLMEVLTGDDVPAQFQTDAEVFQALTDEVALQQEETEIPDGLELRLKERIRQEEAKESSVMVLKPTPRIGKRWWTVAAACVLLVIFSVLHIFSNRVTDELYAASDITQQEAEAYADYALTMIGSHLKAGMQELDEVARVQEQIRTSINEIVY